MSSPISRSRVKYNRDGSRGGQRKRKKRGSGGEGRKGAKKYLILTASKNNYTRGEDELLDGKASDCGTPTPATFGAMALEKFLSQYDQPWIMLPASISFSLHRQWKGRASAGGPW